MTQHAQKNAMRALGRLPAGMMNKTEAAYAAHLTQRVQAGEVLSFQFEALRFRLAQNTFYTPDFLVMLADRTLEVHEVKGFWEDDARVKTKVAAAQFTQFQFVGVMRGKKKDGGGWVVELF